MPPPDTSASYWDETLPAFWNSGGGALWRTYCDRLHTGLLRDWLAGTAPGRILKTDLFDEAAGPGLAAPLARNGGIVHGIDLSPKVTAQAAARNPTGRFVTADVRRLPFPDGYFDAILSNSTLDHFASHDAIADAMRELNRVLSPGGRLLITFDNLSNPVLALRRALPFGLLHRAGLVPYFVGESVSASGLRTLLDRHGFEAQRTSTLMHVPRAAAIPLCNWIERRAPRAAPGALRAMLACERFGGWPSRHWTGYFLTALAVKAASTVPPSRETAERGTPTAGPRTEARTPPTGT